MQSLRSITLVVCAAACGTAPPAEPPTASNTSYASTGDTVAGDGAESGQLAGPAGQGIDRVEKTDAEWRALLDDEGYEILREKGTERAFSGEYWDTKKVGTYRCAGCGLALFDSDAKYDSGTGWPSFWAPAAEGHVTEDSDTTFGMTRTEILCAACDGHLGHVFDDGPEPTGLRYCVNSASLQLVPR